MRDPLNEIQIAIEHETCRVIAMRFTLENERRRNMSRLSEKLAAAAAVAPRQAAKIEARAEAIIASESELEAMTDDAFSVHEALLDEARKGVQDLKHELATMSNNPPLEHSTPSPAAVGAVAEPKLYPDSAFTHVERVALGPHPDQPQAMPETTEGAIWVKTPASGGNAAKAYDEAVKLASEGQQAAATFRAAE
jgi:hypothetical protein